MIDILKKNGRWLAVIGALLAVSLAVLIAKAASPGPKITAEAPQESEVTFDMEKNKAYTSDDGVIVIPASAVLASGGAGGEIHAQPVSAGTAIGDTPEAALKAAPLGPGDYTMPEQARMKDGSIGLLSIPSLGLAVNVYETDNEMEAMTHGLAHFKTTSSFDGNIGLCGHNVNFDLTDGHFKNIHKLKAGDAITYQTALGLRSYTVSVVQEIGQDDWSYLGRTDDNRVTLVTCVSGRPAKRLVVQAVES